MGAIVRGLVVASLLGAATAGADDLDATAHTGEPPSVEIDPGVACQRAAADVARGVEQRGKRVLTVRCTTRERLAKITLPDGSPDRSVVWYVRARGHWVNLRTPPGVGAVSFEGEGHYVISDATGEVVGRGASPDPGAKVRGGERRELAKGR